MFHPVVCMTSLVETPNHWPTGWSKSKRTELWVCRSTFYVQKFPTRVPSLRQSSESESPHWHVPEHSRFAEGNTDSKCTLYNDIILNSELVMTGNWTIEIYGLHSTVRTSLQFENIRSISEDSRDFLLCVQWPKPILRRALHFSLPGFAAISASLWTPPLSCRIPASHTFLYQNFVFPPVLRVPLKS